MAEAFSEVETRRVASLARLHLADDEVARLAGELRDIMASFTDLAAHAATLPEAPEPDEAAPRADHAVPEDEGVARDVIAQAAHVDEPSGLLRAPRGTNR